MFSAISIIELRLVAHAFTFLVSVIGLPPVAPS
jgi:hypothetical protein